MIDTDTYKPAIIVDLDGTLLEGNSFTSYMWWLLGKSVLKFRFDATFPLLSTIARRALRRITHAEAKERIMRISRRFIKKESEHESFIRSIILKFRPDIIYVMAEARMRSLPVCLATAAPVDYSLTIGKLLPIDMVVATLLPEKEGEIKECRGDMKRQRVEELFGELGWRPAITLTDHYDDIPLMFWTTSCGGKNVLIDPSKATVNQVKKAGIPTMNFTK